MKCTPIALTLMALATPALAQGLPALEGEGSQVQSVELLDGAVSVSVESSGSMSLGRGDDHIDGDLGITINDVTLGTGGTDDAGNPDNSSGARTATGDTVAASPVPSATAPATSGQPVVGRTIANSDVCVLGLVSAEELANAFDHAATLVWREATCGADGSGAAMLAASEPRLVNELARAGRTPDQVVAITLDDGSVIVDLALRD